MAENKSVPHSFTKDGVYYFVRRIPSDLRHHYTSPKISYSLRTRSGSVAASRAVRAAQKLDEYWYHLRIQDVDLPGKHMLRLAQAGARPAAPPVAQQGIETITLSEAVGIYLRLKGADRPATFHRAAERACGYVIDVCGDRSITEYTKADANAFRDDLLKRGLTGSSITRVFGTVRSVINFATSEIGVDITNPFGRVYFDRNAGVEGRDPIPSDAICVIQAECQRINDELRWLVAMVSDTGMRLAEAAGLSVSDIELDSKIPHVVIREHPWRRLKTAGSARVVPLIGASLWAAHRVVASARPEGQGFAFPRYNKSGQTNSNSASAALNKWLKPFVPSKCTMHSFRHSMRDRLRAVECPADIVDQIGGWQTEGVGHSYGHGYPIEVTAKWLSRTLNSSE